MGDQSPAVWPLAWGRRSRPSASWCWGALALAGGGCSGRRDPKPATRPQPHPQQCHAKWPEDHARFGDLVAVWDLLEARSWVWAACLPSGAQGSPRSSSIYAGPPPAAPPPSTHFTLVLKAAEHKCPGQETATGLWAEWLWS